VLYRNLFEVLAPVLGETYLLLALLIKFAHDVVKTLLEARLENSIVFVSCTDDCFVMMSVLNFHLTGNLVLNALGSLAYDTTH